MYKRRVKRIKTVVQVENPGEIVVFDAEAKPCETFHLTEERFRKNPEKQTLLKLHPDHFHELSLWQYRSNPNRLWIAINREYCSVDYFEAKSLYLTIRRALTALKKGNRPQNKP